jgi:hypothetical protein
MFLLVSVISLAILVPTYALMHKDATFRRDEIPWNFSRLDALTLAAALNDGEIVFIALIVTVLYTMLAYYFLYSFCDLMSQTEFTTEDQFIERFVAKHAIMIRGVNTQIGTE